MASASDEVGVSRWWHSSVGYEVYIRSFADSSGDGVGDLAGITSRLGHIAELGANVVWITPFYPSPMADFGYDVADYVGVDALFGDIDDVENLTVEAHALGLKVVLDLVPNHCSDQHGWFTSAVADPTGPYRDYFIWADPAADGGPPNNWVSYFGGPAWTIEPASGQYYLHLFLPQQPDLNWRNPVVLDEFDDILRCWLDRGIDGFRIDVAQALVKDAHLRSNPERSPWNPNGSRWEQWDAFDHRHDVGQPETLDIFARWARITRDRDAVLIGETYVLDSTELATMLRGDGLDVGFWFKAMHIDWNADDIRSTLRDPVDALADPRSLGWVSSSHDEARSPTRFGGGDLGRRRALTFSTLLFCLPGLPFLYQGEELGLVEGVVPPDRVVDPVDGGATVGRDGCRTPMPWEPTPPAFGFSEADETWLPLGGRTDADTASVQRASAHSWLARYTELAHVRRSHEHLSGTEVEWVEDVAPGIIALRRGSLYVVANVGSIDAPVGANGSIVFSTTGATGQVSESSSIAPDHALIIDTST